MTDFPQPPGRPITRPGPNGGQYSTIRMSDGTIETTLFDTEDNAVATRRTFQGIATVQQEHIKSIQAQLNGGTQ